jgi:CBS domain-containing protein
METQDVLVSSLMQRSVIAIDPDLSVFDALTLAHARGVHHLPLVTAGKLVGIVCTCDLREAPPQSRVSGFAKRDVVTVSGETTAADAARTLQRSAVGSAVVVTDRARVAGILTRDDLIHADARLAELMAESRCESCGTRHHLRLCPDGWFLCVECRERARGDDWFDIGGGD